MESFTAGIRIFQFLFLNKKSHVMLTITKASILFILKEIPLD
jgi:hypothetical protein